MKLYAILLLLLPIGMHAQNPELVADLAPFPYESAPGAFCNFDGKLFFAANRYDTFYSNRELFVSDGTTSGTQLFKELVAGTTGSSPDNFIVRNGKMYFTVYNQFASTAYEIPYVSDGTPQGTFPLSTDPDVAVIGGNVQAARFIFVALGDYVYFQSYEPNSPHNRVLYRTDGTQAGTQIVVQMPNNSGAPTLMQGPIKLGNKLLFASQENANGSNLYQYDPADGSVTMVRANTVLHLTYGWAEYDNKVYFTANNLNDLDHLAEPWVSDGTTAGTYELANLNTTPAADSAPGSYEVMNDKLFFLARASGFQNTTTLFAIDAASTGLPVAIADIGGPTTNYSHTYLYQSEGKFYFRGDSATHGSEPWQSDGTTAGTAMIKDIWAGTSGTVPHTFLRYCDDVYFSAANPATGASVLYKTDGTVAGTVLIPGLAASPNTLGSGVTNKAVLNNQLFFTAAFDTNALSELYRYDAECALSTEGFSKVKLIGYPNPSADGRFTISGAKVSQIAVFDALGRSILVRKIGENTFEIQSGRGLYIAKTDVGHFKLLIQP